MYDTAEWANAKLHGTIVRLEDGTPIYVIKCFTADDGKIGVVYRLLRTDQHRECLLENLNLEPVPLGYVNHTAGSAIYIARLPLRQDWKQGLRHGNYVIKGRGTAQLNEVSLLACITGQFHDLKACIDRAAKTGHKKAFHRHWAVGGDGELLYKDDVVGTVDRETYNVSFSPEFCYLETRYHEDMHNGNSSGTDKNQ